jgi:hypothetical protein
MLALVLRDLMTGVGKKSAYLFNEYVRPFLDLCVSLGFPALDEMVREFDPVAVWDK